jgi:predicted ATP-binding protein involved in virulence
MTLRAEKLHLRNFRCFREATLDLHPQLTVIVADNGMGKTALLDAIAVGMAEYVDRLLGVRTSRGLLASDVRTANGSGGPAQLSMTAKFGGQDAAWSLTRKSATSSMRRGERQLAAVRDIAARHRETFGTADSGLSLFVFYQSSRFAHSSYFGQKFGTMKTSPVGRLMGFVDYLTPLSEVARFNEWYAVRWRAVAKRASRGLGPGQDPLAQLSAVRTAVAQVLAPTGWSLIDWDDERRCVVVEHATRGRLPLSWLSSGIRSMIALVADLAYRCACLNPHLGQDAAVKTPGLALIDEVDLHLHPSWQQRVVELLQAAFGSMQFVLTTHSPQVLSTVYVESVRVVHHDGEESTVTRPLVQTRGVESADVLAKVMSVHPVPEVQESQWLSDYRAMAQSGRYGSEAGLKLWYKLIQHFGATHPALADIAVIRRLHDFKQAHGLTSGSDGGSNAQA